MSDRYADEPCPYCEEPMADHESERVEQEDGQSAFRLECP